MQPNPRTQSDMLAALRPILDAAGAGRYRKYRNILAKRAQAGEKIETITADGLETVNTAQAGDYIVRNTTEAGEQYLLGAEKFEKRYRPLAPPDANGWQMYEPNSEIFAVQLSPELLHRLQWPSEFYFIARWGEKMIAKTGDFLALPPDCSEVYRIAEKEFFETYKPA